MDRKEPEFERTAPPRQESPPETLQDTLEDSLSRDTAAISSPDTAELEAKSGDLLRQGEALFAAGLFQRAVHVWTRILFLERGNPAARRAIERGKRALAEQQRRLDAEISTCEELVVRGEIEAARRRTRAVLATDPRHGEARNLLARIDRVERRPQMHRTEVSERDDPRVSPASTSESSPRARSSLHGPSHRRAPTKPAATLPAVRVRMPRGGPRRPANRRNSPAKMAVFLLIALLVFITGGVTLFLHWEQLVSDGPFAVSGSSPSEVVEAPRDLPAVPSESELHYFDGARLFAKGRYREALAQLRRVDRRSSSAEQARGLVLRIEERLLRGADDGDPAVGDDASAGDQKVVDPKQTR